MSDQTVDEKRKARQAKLLAKGAARLEKITGAAGQDRIISDPNTRKAPVVRAVTATTGTLDDDVDDPLEVDLSTLPLPLPANESESGRWPPSNGEPDLLAQLLQQMAQGPLGGSGSPDAGRTMPVPVPPASPFPAVHPKTLLDRLFPLVHLVAMVALAVYAVGWLEPTRKFGMYGWMGVGGSVDWAAWAALGRTPPRNNVLGAVGHMSGVGLAEVPLIWLFVSVELVLQTTRLFLVRNHASPPSLVSTILPLVSQFSPQLGLLIHTAIKYLALLAIIVNDLAVLVFCIGVAVVYGRYRAGPDAGVMEHIVQGSGAGWNAARVEL